MHEFDVTATISLFLSLFLFGGKEVVTSGFKIAFMEII